MSLYSVLEKESAEVFRDYSVSIRDDSYEASAFDLRPVLQSSLEP